MVLGRRALLKASCISPLFWLSGCSALEEDPTQQPLRRLGLVSIHNDIEQDVVVSAIIIRDNERIYWNEFEIPGTTTKNGLKMNRSVSIVPPDDYSAKQGHYLVGVRIQNLDVSNVFELSDATTDDDNCYHVMVSLLENGPAFATGLSDEYTNCP